MLEELDILLCGLVGKYGGDIFGVRGIRHFILGEALALIYPSRYMGFVVVAENARD
jgi:hypothetical protein